MVNLFAITQMANATYLAHISQIAQMANATHLAQMSRFLAIQDNQAILKSNVAGAVSQLITERCNVDLAKWMARYLFLTCVLACALSIQSNTALCPSRMSILGNWVLFVQHLDMSQLSCVQQTPT